MEPVEGTHKSGDELCERIVAGDMCELVSQHDTTMRVGPIESVFRNKNHRSARSPGERRADDGAAEEEHWLADAGVPSHFIENFTPVGAVKRPRTRGDTIESDTSDC